MVQLHYSPSLRFLSGRTLFASTENRSSFFILLTFSSPIHTSVLSYVNLKFSCCLCSQLKAKGACNSRKIKQHQCRDDSTDICSISITIIVRRKMSTAACVLIIVCWILGWVWWHTKLKFGYLLSLQAYTFSIFSLVCAILISDFPLSFKVHVFT
jgi:hypothetical protein